MPESMPELARYLPAEHVGDVTSIAPLGMGASGASVYAITTSRGELVLRIHNSAAVHGARWEQQLLVLERAAAAGAAPPILHIDHDARAVVSVRVAGVPLAAALAASLPLPTGAPTLPEPAQREAIFRGVVATLRTVHALDPSGLDPADPLAFARRQFAAQRGRPHFPAWANALEPIFADLEATLARDPRRVVSHNDLNPGNILWDGARAWLVDWEVAALTHPYYDLATFAMFLRLDDDTAGALLAAQQESAVDDAARATFAALRRVAALLCGLTFISLLPDDHLGELDEEPRSLADFYAELRSGRIHLGDPRGRAAFALSLLRAGL